MQHQEGRHMHVIYACAKVHSKCILPELIWVCLRNTKYAVCHEAMGRSVYMPALTLLLVTA